MHELLQKHVLGWLRSLNLPDPEFDYVVEGTHLDIAYPDDQLGLRIDEQHQEIKIGEWTIWLCQDEKQAYRALAAIGSRLGITPDYLPLELRSIEQMLIQGLFDNALEAVEQIEQLTPEIHPDYEQLKELKKRIRTAKRRSGTAQPSPHISRSTFVRQLKNDISHISNTLPDHNIFGFFTAEPSVLEVVDAVWLLNVRDGESNVWAATAAGNPAASFDPDFETKATELDLLTSLFEKLGNSPTFIWDSVQVMPVLRSWYFRSTGSNLPETYHFFDLRALCLVAFPTARRTDRPESLCQELNISYLDATGQGSPLAAINALLMACIQRFGELDVRLGAALRRVLRRTILNGTWLDVFIPPAGNSSDFSGYIEMLLEHYEHLPAPIKRSIGQRDAGDLQVNDFFRAGGFLAQSQGNAYRVRDGQVKFAEHISTALHTDSPHILEAGTGIGKTIGYLVPLLLTGRRAFVSTHTKSLQDQAWNKDVPTVLRAFEQAGIARAVAILKGKSNYFSPQLLEASLDDLNAILGNSEAKAFAFASLLNWAVSTSTAYLDELEGVGQPEIIYRFSRDNASPSSDETWAQRDPYNRAVEVAQDADVVLLNHSLVFALAKLGQPENSEVDAIIFDEAHNIEDVATEALTLNFDAWALKAEIQSLLGRDASGRVRGLLETIIGHDQAKTNPTIRDFATALFEVENCLSNWCLISGSRFAELGKERTEQDVDTPLLFAMNLFLTDSLRQEAQTLQDHLQTLIATLDNLLKQLLRLSGIPRRLQSRLLGSLASLQDHLVDSRDALQGLLTDDTEQITWGEANILVTEDEQLTLFTTQDEWRGILHVTPLDVANWLKSTLPSLYAHRIYVSATLAIGGNFGSIIARLGLSEDNPVTAIFPSPYNLRQQALLAVPTDMPYPQASGDALYIETLSSHIADLAKISDGYALVLFTSRRTLDEVAPRLSALLSDGNISVLAQNSHNRTAIVERFRTAPQHGEKLVLLGLRSFWEGVDFPGALKLLVISRLPFDFTGHPVASARRTHYLSQGFDRDFFHEVVIPTTLLHLRQMVGRLIRREEDRGVCIIADPRIQNKLYGRYMLKQLLESQRAIGKRVEVLDRVQQFLRNPELNQDLFDLAESPEQVHELSLEQQTIVASPARRIAVEATAGSGKTRTLVERIVQLINTGRAKPDEILVLTFTNKARDVMLERLEQKLSADASPSLTRNVLTYHKFAARILRSVQSDDPKFLDENQDELIAFLNNARRAAKINDQELSDEDGKAVISYAQNGLIDETELADVLTQLDPFLSRLAKFFLDYVNQLRQHNLLDYGEAIVQAVRALRDDVETRQRWSSKFKWIFCDEYQDTTPAQAALISLIGQNANLMVVGDSAQSIYTWQGADPDNLRRFSVDFPGAATFSLSRNFRSFPNLVRTAEHFLRETKQFMGTSIKYDEQRDAEQQRVYFLTNPDKSSEAHAIIQIARKVNPETQAEINTVGVLARKWSLLEDVEVECIRQTVPYTFEGESPRGLTADTDIKSLIERAKNLVVRNSKIDHEVGDSPDGRIIRDLRSGQIEDAAQLIVRVAEMTGQSQIQATDKFSRFISLLRGKPTASLISLYNSEETPIITLSTIHGQKGEEFHTVIVIGLEQNNTPNKPPRSHEQMLQWRKLVQERSRATWRTSLSHGDLQRAYEQEEERIFYVAMTRAVHNLVVSTCLERGTPSHYLDLARLKDSTQSSSNPSEIVIAHSPQSLESVSYRSDGRRFLSNAGVYVRSKSEMLLANEFHRRGMYFDYEESLENISNALPDFTFPDYGGVILEHLGMLDDAQYRQRWEAKAQQYRTQGIQFFFTTEENIQHLQKTVDELKQQFLALISSPQQAQMIEFVEQMRRQSEIKIGRAIGNIENGILRVDGHNKYIALMIAQEEDTLPSINVIDGIQVNWEKAIISGIHSWLAIPL